MESVSVASAALNQPEEIRLPASRRRIALFSAVSLAAGIAVAFWCERIQYEKFSGYLQARLRTVSASREAQVSELLVTPGTVVTAGQPLVRLKDTAFEQRMEAKQREVESLEIELSQSQARLEVELELRRKSVLESIFDAKLKSAQAARARNAFSTGMNRDGGWGSRSTNSAFERAAAGNEDRPQIEQVGTVQPAGNAIGEGGKSAASEVELCSQHIEELERINRELPAKISRSMSVDLAQARLAHARAELARLDLQKRELTLVAEKSGMVGVFHKGVGDHVAAHEPIVQLLDEEQPYLLLQVPSPRVSDFAPGTLVELCFPGGKKGAGRVEEIPPQTSPIPGEGASSCETVITAHVEPVGKLWPELPFGSLVEVRRRR
jgi:multidrug resistance efflux pump